MTKTLKKRNETFDFSHQIIFFSVIVGGAQRSTPVSTALGCKWFALSRWIQNSWRHTVEKINGSFIVISIFSSLNPDELRQVATVAAVRFLL